MARGGAGVSDYTYNMDLSNRPLENETKVDGGCVHRTRTGEHVFRPNPCKVGHWDWTHGNVLWAEYITHPKGYGTSATVGLRSRGVGWPVCRAMHNTWFAWMCWLLGVPGPELTTPVRQHTAAQQHDVVQGTGAECAETMLHTMVHRHHMDIFTDYHPPGMHVREADTWLLAVYGGARTRRLTDWVVSWNVGQPTTAAGREGGAGVNGNRTGAGGGPSNARSSSGGQAAVPPADHDHGNVPPAKRHLSGRP